MTYASKAVANYFLDLAERDGETLSAMKLQKLIYFAHGWRLALNHCPLIDEAVEAWEYGPVIPTVYHEFKNFGSGPIRKRAQSYSFSDSLPFSYSVSTPSIPEHDHETREFLEAIWQAYKGFSAVQLSNLTHELGSPWCEIYSQNKGRKGVDIPDDEIERYFERAASSRDN